jgi:hypothetical protein
MPCEEEILKADELCKDDCILEPEVIVTVKEEVKVSAEDLEFISHDIYKCQEMYLNIFIIVWWVYFSSIGSYIDTAQPE